MAEFQEYDELDYDQSVIEDNNSSIDELDSENVTLMGLAIDNSGSMGLYIGAMADALASTKKAMAASKNSDEIRISRIDFDNESIASGYIPVADMDTTYQKSISFGGTAIYDMIVKDGEAMREYRKYLCDNGYHVRAVFAIFTDGEDMHSDHSIQEAKQVIDAMAREEIITVMIEFGAEAAGIAKALGISKSISCGSTDHELRNAFAMVSKSVVSVSQNVAANDAFDF